MFEGALLDSSPRQTSVLSRIHYLISAFAGTVVLALGLYLIPLLLMPAGARPLFIAATLGGGTAALYTLMLGYVWSDSRQQQLRTLPWLTLTLLLNLPGLLIYLVYSARKSGDWKRAAIPLAYVVQTMIVGVLVLVPLIYTQALPRQLMIIEVLPLPPPGRPPAPPVGQRPRTPTHRVAVDPLTAPVSIPPIIRDIHDQPEPPQIATGPTGTGVIGVPNGLGTRDGVIGSPLWGPEPLPPPPPQHAASKPSVIRLSMGVVNAKAIYQPKPEYPHIAQIARIQGTVVLQAIIGRDGTIQDLKVMSGNPYLNSAAIDAVKSWRYQPTLLNNEAVEVLTEIDVIFHLGE